MSTFVFPEQHPDPFPSFAAPTDSEEWGMRDARVWVWECDPPRDEVHAVYEEHAKNLTQSPSYEEGVEDALYGVKGAGMEELGIDFSPGAVNVMRW